MFGQDINLIDLRQQSNGTLGSDELVGFRCDRQKGQATEGNNMLSRETLTNLQNENLMDLQLATHSKLHSGAYKRSKGAQNVHEQSAYKKNQMQQLEVKISPDGQTISFLSNQVGEQPNSSYSLDAQFSANGMLKPKQRKKAEKSMQLQMRL